MSPRTLTTPELMLSAVPEVPKQPPWPSAARAGVRAWSAAVAVPAAMMVMVGDWPRTCISASDSGRCAERLKVCPPGPLSATLRVSR